MLHTHLNWYENIIVLSLVRHFTIYMTISSKFCLSVCGSAISHNLTRIHRTIYWLLMCTMCQANLFINYSFKVPPLSPNAFTPFFLLRLECRQATLLVVRRPAMPEEIECVSHYTIIYYMHVFCDTDLAFRCPSALCSEFVVLNMKCGLNANSSV